MNSDFPAFPLPSMANSFMTKGPRGKSTQKNIIFPWNAPSHAGDILISPSTWVSGPTCSWEWLRSPTMTGDGIQPIDDDLGMVSWLDLHGFTTLQVVGYISFRNHRHKSSAVASQDCPCTPHSLDVAMENHNLQVRYMLSFVSQKTSAFKTWIKPFKTLEPGWKAKICTLKPSETPVFC